tara:strand:- start:808 stop:1407 length:600 start_codon:yes stop_codon:yes gene_type:complete
MFEFDILPMSNPGVIRGTLPMDTYNSVMSEIKEIENYGSPNTYNHRLAGAIEKEYELLKSKSSLNPFLLEMSKEYSKNFGSDVANRVGEMWVNYQQKNEYNPMHSHDGILSFVIWMKIPYKISDELQMKNVKNAKHPNFSASSFEFVYNNILGELTTLSLPVDEGWEGRIVMFPSKLTHQVYPFQTSDGYRISISGNLY